MNNKKNKLLKKSKFIKTAPKSKLRIKNTNSIKQRWNNNNVEEQQDSKPLEDRPRKINADIAVISTFIQGSNYERARMAQENRYSEETLSYIIW